MNIKTAEKSLNHGSRSNTQKYDLIQVGFEEVVLLRYALLKTYFLLYKVVIDSLYCSLSISTFCRLDKIFINLNILYGRRPFWLTHKKTSCDKQLELRLRKIYNLSLQEIYSSVKSLDFVCPFSVLNVIRA